jgi:hypothetical protein
MMRGKQLFMTVELAIMCTALYMAVRKYNPESEQLSVDALKRVNHIVSKSQRFNSQITEPTSANKMSTKSNSYNVIEGENDLLVIAKKISGYNKIVLVTMVNDAYLKFTYSWLCNTKTMGIHKSVLIITLDQMSKEKLIQDWPDISVVAMNMQLHGNQTYSKVGYVKIMIKRTEIILSLLVANIEVLLFEVDCVWLSNPVPDLQKITGYDFLVNPVAKTNTRVFAGGFLWINVTDNAKALWRKLEEEMIALGERISQMLDNAPVSERENDQQFFSRLIREKYVFMLKI